ncbi:hypothetical protein AKJ16_DCAP24044 [Drosera capensis]
MAAACDGLLDLVMSVEGRRRLVEANGLVYLISSISYSNDMASFNEDFDDIPHSDGKVRF